MTKHIKAMFDTHCHLQDVRISDRTGDVVANANSAGVIRMLCCGSSPEDWDGVARIGAEYGRNGVICAYGVHPLYLGRIDLHGNEWTAELSKRLVNDPSAAIGEIGLDHTVNPRDDAKQAAAFTSQLKIAERFGRPVSIHCRGAFGDLMSILRSNGGLKHGGAIHSYSGSPESVAELAGLGCHISFSGTILIPNCKRAVAALKTVPKDRLLLETDSPDLPPPGATGPNEPSNLSLILNKAAEVLGEPPEKLAKLTLENGDRLYGLRANTVSPHIAHFTKNMNQND